MARTNRSDMDFVTLPAGYAGNTRPVTFVVWGSGNQGNATPPNAAGGASVAG